MWFTVGFCLRLCSAFSRYVRNIEAMDLDEKVKADIDATVDAVYEQMQEGM